MRHKSYQRVTKEATQEAELHFNAQAQRMAISNVEIEETEASQRVATEDSNDRAEATARIVSQNDKPDNQTAEPVIIYPEEEDWEKLDGPAQNTRSQNQTRTITQECMLATLEISKAAMTPRQAAMRK